MMHTLYEVEAHMDDLNRQAAQHRLAQESRNSQPTASFVRNSRHWLGQALIWLGSRLHQPVCEPVKPAVVSNGSAALSLNEAACW